ncbi:MAG TPA: hypothetical protein PKH77_01100 [Anaerolineae bacterium]|nr:hypothetical protein [Anaerolineae bacterium]
MANIDLLGIFFNSLWIIGLAVLLATWSYAYYEAGKAKVKARNKFQEFGYALALDAGAALFIAGMATTEDRWWGRGLWIALGAVVLLHAGQIIWARRRANQETPPHA